MASEKADLPQDTDSLPPNYASSETYSDSPPPAYRKTNTVRLQITRVVCLTVLLAGFLTGTFILAHTWITTRNACNCAPAPNLPPQSGALIQASVLPEVESLVDAEPKMEEAKNSLDEPEFDQQSRQMDIPLPLYEEDVKEDLKNIEEAIEEESDGLQNIEEEPKDVRLPVDMLLGNPSLAGKDVQCKVQKKIQNIGSGILSKTIMVTCDDEDSAEDRSTEDVPSAFGTLLGARPLPRPPMSLLAPILKMMAARANARLHRQMKPKIVLRRFPQSIGPFPQPFNSPFSSAGPVPFPPQMINSGMPNIQQKSFPEPMPLPGNSVIQPNMAPSPIFPQNDDYDVPFSNMQQDTNEEPQRNILFRDDFNKDKEIEPIFRPFPPPQPEEPEPLEHNESPIKVIQGFPPQIPDAIKQIVSKIMKGDTDGDTPNNMPVIAIKAIPDPQLMDSNQNSPKSKLLLPFPFRAVKIQSRGARKLGDDEEIGNIAPFPLPRGAIPAGLKPVVMPEAGGRALDSPVTLPTMQEMPPLRFFPGRLLRLPMPLHGRAITHMEIKENPNSLPFEEEQEIPTALEVNEPNDPENVSEEPFGPPRHHTVITKLPAVEDNISQDTSQIPPFISRFPPPPPPSFARLGRSGIVKEINPDAELVTPAETREHHVISVN